jgi:hypothetical protein
MKTKKYLYFVDKETRSTFWMWNMSIKKGRWINFAKELQNPELWAEGVYSSLTLERFIYSVNCGISLQVSRKEFIKLLKANEQKQKNKQ